MRVLWLLLAITVLAAGIVVAISWQTSRQSGDDAMVPAAPTVVIPRVVQSREPELAAKTTAPPLETDTAAPIPPDSKRELTDGAKRPPRGPAPSPTTEPANPPPPPPPPPPSGSIRIRGPVGGEVFLGEKHSGAIDASGEFVIPSLTAGTHAIRVLMTDRPAFQTSVTVADESESLVIIPPAVPPPPPEPPATTPARSFNIPSAVGSRMLSISSREVRYERLDSHGRSTPESFAVPCADVTLVKGRFGMSLQMTLKSGAKTNVEVRDRLLAEILSAFSDACGPR